MTNENSLLERTLAENLSWNAARIKFLSRFLIALLAARTVNLAQIAVFFGGRATADSSHKRIRRFLRFFDIPQAELARLVVRWMKLEPPFVLSLDRTEWRLGKSWVNVLMLAVVSESGVAIPLLWLVFEKKGCSDAEERKQILKQYLRLFPVSTIGFVTADREFACREWLQFLDKEKIPFCLRIKSSAFITDKRGGRMRASKLLRTGRVGEKLYCRRRRKMCGVKVAVAGLKKADGDNVIVISSFEAKDALSEYCLRWQIETLFGCLKSRGFCLEETHLTDKDRVSRLLALLTLAFCWALLSGKLVCQTKALKQKKHGRLEKSVFRAGLDYLRRLFCRPANEGQKQERKQLILLLSRT